MKIKIIMMKEINFNLIFFFVILSVYSCKKSKVLNISYITYKEIANIGSFNDTIHNGFIRMDNGRYPKEIIENLDLTRYDYYYSQHKIKSMITNYEKSCGRYEVECIVDSNSYKFGNYYLYKILEKKNEFGLPCP